MSTKLQQTPSSQIGTAAPAGVAAGPITPHLVNTTVNGTVRSYAYFSPDPTATDPVPMVLAFHGGGGNATIMARALAFDSLVAPKPYIAVFPQGYDPYHQSGSTGDGVWNSGQGWAPYQDQTDPPQDDVAFVDTILIEMASVAAAQGLRVDQDRTYAVGFSSGGMMTYRLAAERSREFAAVAVMQASIGGDPDPADPNLPFHINHPADHGADPVSVLQLHGLIDTNVALTEGQPASGATPRTDLPVIDAVHTWVDHNNCNPHATIDPHPMGLMRTWADGDAGTEVKLLSLPGSGHEVPEGAIDVIEPFLLSHAK